MSLLFGIAAAIASTICFYEWRKYKDREFLRISFFGFGLAILSIWSYISRFVDLPSAVRDPIYYTSQILRIIFIAGLLILGGKIILRKK